MIRTVGFVGLGAMGMRMAANLARAGFEVRGFDVRDAAMKAHVDAGGVCASSAPEAARGADALVLMVVNAAQASAVLFEAGALDALAPNGVVAVMATCPPAEVASLAARVQQTGRRFIDAPVSGGTSGASAGSLTIMAAAPKETFNAAKSLLAAMGSKLTHVGEAPGQGAAVKVVNQLLCGVHIAAAAEALSLARKMGIDAGALLEILGGSAASSWMLRDRGPRMLERDPDVNSAVDIFVKDLGIVLAAGQGGKASLPLAAIAHQMFLAASAQGIGALDDSQVIRVFDALNGFDR